MLVELECQCEGGQARKQTRPGTGNRAGNGTGDRARNGSGDGVPECSESVRGEI